MSSVLNRDDTVPSSVKSTAPVLGGGVRKAKGVCAPNFVGTTSCHMIGVDVELGH